MTAWIYLGLVLLSGAGMVTTYFKGVEDAELRFENSQLIAERAAMLAQAGTEERLALLVDDRLKKIRIEEKTYVKNFKTIREQNTVYRDCQHTDDAFRLLNSALKGDGLPTQSSVQGSLSK